jgi:hypothetical protein
MNHKKSIFYFLPLSFAIIISSCQGQEKNESVNRSKKDSVPVEKNDNTFNNGKRPDMSKLATGKGSLSFKLNGQLYQTDPGHTKCWSTASVPLAMMMAKGDGLSISWQMGYKEGERSYKLDGDDKGTVNFTIGGKTYWTRSVKGDNYLDIKITEVKDKYSLKMLSGTFEGVLEDKDRNKVQITEGKFVTEDIGRQ